MDAKRIYVVGIGRGDAEGMTAEAREAILTSDVIVGYRTYVALVARLFPEKTYIESGMREEIARCKRAIAMAKEGRGVCVISGGDSTLYGMCGLLYELAEKDGMTEEIVICPVAGVTAALSGGALLGAPLSNDYMTISLSNHLTAWETTMQRVRLAAACDLCIVLYNPRSKARPWHLREVCEELLTCRDSGTICGIASYIGREGETAEILTLEELAKRAKDEGDVTIHMQSTVFIGCSETMLIQGKMVTRRGYHKKYEDA